MNDVRWLQRFNNFDSAYRLLQEVCERGITSLSQLEQEGAVQRFEMTYELAWKTLKDYMEFTGKTIIPITPRNVIKEAFAAEIIEDGQIWIDMMLHRNLLSHTYDIKTFEKVLVHVEEQYEPALGALHRFLSRKRSVQ